MLGLDRAVAEQRAYLPTGRLGCEEKHAADGGKFCCDLQEHSGAPLASSNWLGPRGRSD